MIKCISFHFPISQQRDLNTVIPLVGCEIKSRVEVGKYLISVRFTRTTHWRETQNQKKCEVIDILRATTIQCTVIDNPLSKLAKYQL
jgi:hypothetical protein